MVIDACGRSCPEPVIMAKKALASGEGHYEVLVDNQTAVGNVSRFAQNAGYGVSVKNEGEIFRMELVKQK